MVGGLGGGRSEGTRPKRRRRAALLVAGAIALSGLTAAAIAARTAGRRPLAGHLTASQIAHTMWRTTLVGEPFEHFYPAGQLTRISDGAGGDLTAEIGVVLPSADGDGQLVFFWHNRRFVGWDSTTESMSILQLQPLGSRSFEATYSNYAPGDPACCPSLIPLSVSYRWDGRHFVAEGELPMYAPVPARVRLTQ